MLLPTFVTVVPDFKEYHSGYSHSWHLVWSSMVLVVHNCWYVQIAFTQFKYPTSSLMNTLWYEFAGAASVDQNPLLCVSLISPRQITQVSVKSWEQCLRGELWLSCTRCDHPLGWPTFYCLREKITLFLANGIVLPGAPLGLESSHLQVSAPQSQQYSKSFSPVASSSRVSSPATLISLFSLLLSLSWGNSEFAGEIQERHRASSPSLLS